MPSRPPSLSMLLPQSTRVCWSPCKPLFRFLPKHPHQEFCFHQICSLTKHPVALQDLEATTKEGSQEARKTMNDKMHRCASFDIGDFIWIQEQPTPHMFEKLAPKFLRPHQVTRQWTPVTKEAHYIHNSRTSTHKHTSVT